MTPPPSLAARLGGLVRLTHPFPSLLDGLATFGARARRRRLGRRRGPARHRDDRAPGRDRVRRTTSSTRRRRRSQAREADPERPRAARRRARSWPWSQAALGARTVGPVGVGDRRGRPGRARASASPTTSGSRERPGRGCRSRSGSRSCRSSRGSGRPGRCPPAFAVLVPVAVAAGAALAIGNARADVERDAASGVASIAIALGPRRAWAVQVVILAAVGVVAVGSAAPWRGAAARPGRPDRRRRPGPPLAAAASRDLRPAALERAWEVEAIGVAALGVAWLWACSRITTRPEIRPISHNGARVPGDPLYLSMNRVTRHARGLLVAVAVLALTAGAAFARAADPAAGTMPDAASSRP